MRVRLGWIAFVGWAGCAGGDGDGASTPTDAAPVEAPAYDARGPWPVGTARVEVTGTDGLVLPTQVWYPAAAEGGAAVVYDGLLAGDAFEGVAADCDPASPHPALAFSHGYGGTRYQSPFFTEFLASWGYVVIAPDHVGNTFVDLSGDFAELVVRRPTDVRDVVDWLFAEAGNPTSPYAGCVDPADGYAVSGHSFGGWTALAVGGAVVNDPVGDGTLDLGDPRVWAVLPLAPWDGLGAITTGTSAITAPTMILTGARDATTPIAQVTGLWDPLTVAPRYFGVFADAGHYSFSPVACLLETGDGCGPDFVDEATFTSVVDTAAAGFLEGTRGVDGATDRIPLDTTALDVDWTVVP